MLGKKTAPNAQLINGRANHAAIEYSMLQKVDSYEDLSVGEVSEYFDHSFDEEIDMSGGIGEIEVREGSTLLSDKMAKQKSLNDLRRVGRGLVTTYHNHISPVIQPTAVEKEFAYQPGSLPVKVIGRIDLLTAGEMIDRKTTSRKKYRPEPEWEVQASIYQIIEPVPHTWHISSYTPVHIDTTFVQPPPRPDIAELMLDQVVGEIGYFYRRYGPDQPWPARGKLHSWACNYCGFRPDCWAWQ